MEISEVPELLVKELGGVPQADGFLWIFGRAMIKLSNDFEQELLIWIWPGPPERFFDSASKRHHDAAISYGEPPKGIEVDKPIPIRGWVPGTLWIGYFGASDRWVGKADGILVVERIKDKLIEIAKDNHFTVIAASAKESEAIN